MNQFWVPSKRRLGGFKCVEHIVSRELSLVGKYGEIWQHDAVTFKAIIFSTLIAKRFLPQHQWPQQPGDEILISFGSAEISTWVERLKVPVKPSTQARLAVRSRNEAPVNSNIHDPNGENLSLKGLDQTQKSAGYFDMPPGQQRRARGLKTKKRRLA